MCDVILQFRVFHGHEFQCCFSDIAWFWIKEVERLEADLAHFRTNIKQSSQHGAAEIEERALKLREVVKTREVMLREFEDCIEIEHGKKKFNFDKIYLVFQREINDKKRLMAKLKDKNGVLKHQREKLLKTVRTYLQTKEVRKPLNICILTILLVYHISKLILHWNVICTNPNSKGIM